jgi:hypothetical protein
MATVEMTIVGFSDEFNFREITVNTDRPTIKGVLEKLRDDESLTACFSFEERPRNPATPFFALNQSDGYVVHSMRYRGYRLAAGASTGTPGLEQRWRFCVLRRSGDSRLLIENNRKLSYDQFTVEDGDQIFWGLITSVSKHFPLSSEDYELERLDRLSTV